MSDELHARLLLVDVPDTGTAGEVVQLTVEQCADLAERCAIVMPPEETP